jgi:cation diffusion facilitator family transporter
MKMLERLHQALGRKLIRDFDNLDQRDVRNRYGLLAGWVSVAVILVLFTVKMTLGIMAGSVAVVADAFHLLTHLANAVVLVISFWVASRPPTMRTPFGHGRMEYVAPLIMSIILFVSGFQIAGRAGRQIIEPDIIFFWPALPWILLLTVLVKAWLVHFVQFLGRRVNSEAILAIAVHHRIDFYITLSVIAALILEHLLQRPGIDGYMGIAVTLSLFYSGFNHGKEAVIPILGRAPTREMIGKIRETARGIDGVEDVHEIIVHDYGSMYLISLHAEIPERFGPEKMHATAERLEGALRREYRGEVVCHSDPLLDYSPQIQGIEAIFKEALSRFPRVVDYHDFRVVGDSPGKIIIVADIDAAEEVPEAKFGEIVSGLETHLKSVIPNLSYCTFYVTPKFAY